MRFRAIRRQHLVPGISRSTTNLRPVSPLGVSIEQSSVSRLFPGQRLDVFAQTNPRSSAWSELALVGELISYFVSFFLATGLGFFGFSSRHARSQTPPDDSANADLQTIRVFCHFELFASDRSHPWTRGCRMPYGADGSAQLFQIEQTQRE